MKTGVLFSIRINENSGVAKNGKVGEKNKIEVVFPWSCIPINKPPPVLVPNQEKAKKQEAK